MYKVLNNIEGLEGEIAKDKNPVGEGSSQADRYPIRFILFENFSDYHYFIDARIKEKVFASNIGAWMRTGSDDEMLTYSQLATQFKDHIKHIPATDFVITPFSEIARFYDNGVHKEFDSLIKTIRLIQSPAEAQERHQRIYVPIIGLRGKMARFQNDPNIFVFEVNSNNESGIYNLILTNGTIYGISGLDETFTLCNCFRDWISMWENSRGVKTSIICSSVAIFNCADFAQPDNAFAYTVCNNVYEFLTAGLNLNFGDLQFKEEDMLFWEELARNVDVRTFSFEEFVKKQLGVSHNIETETDFVRCWFENDTRFKRWLLKSYFLSKHNETYLSYVLADCENLTTSEFTSLLATKIFDLPFNEACVAQRSSIICEVVKHDSKITDSAERKVRNALEEMAKNPEGGYHLAMKYMTSLTNSEKDLVVEWHGSGFIERDEFKRSFSELYYYTAPFGLRLEDKNQWVDDYFAEYRKSKIANKISRDLTRTLLEKNASSTTFNEWKDNFKTVKTLLYDRSDIDVFYWFDGLGAEWIPLLKHIIGGFENEGIYLNEMMIAASELPTITAINKIKLEDLADGKLEKIGDIDEFCHKAKHYPQFIIEEIHKVEEMVSSVLRKYNGKKIAFISDHGISYMSQLAEGLSLGNIEEHHGGRYAKWRTGQTLEDKKYIVLEDGETICSLTYDSLSKKTAKGLGAHGGATPEEVLVPIIIVSGQKIASNYSAKLLESNISASYPIVHYEINGIKNVLPMIKYNGEQYPMKWIKENLYESYPLRLVETATKIELKIGNFSKTDSITVRLGAEEDELF